jgi:ATP-dependent Lon protease
MATALISAFTGRPVHREVAMTGEITLRGRVLPVGGIKEKILGAHRAGSNTIILPHQNERDVDEVPRLVKRKLRFVYVRHIGQVLEEALRPPPDKGKKGRRNSQKAEQKQEQETENSEQEIAVSS